jgi:hypothetical protein
LVKAVRVEHEPVLDQKLDGVRALVHERQP